MPPMTTTRITTSSDAHGLKDALDLTNTTVTATGENKIIKHEPI